MNTSAADRAPSPEAARAPAAGGAGSGAGRGDRPAARARVARETGERILAGFARLLSHRPLELIRLDDVAADAAVGVQTIVRCFGGKDGLVDRLQQQLAERSDWAVAPGDMASVIQAVVAEHERWGDALFQLAVQADLRPALAQRMAASRQRERQWLATAFAPWLEPATAEERRRALDALVIATSVHPWKILRRDHQRPVTEYRALMEHMCAAAVAPSHRSTCRAGGTDPRR